MQSYGVPNFATVDEIQRKIQQGQIQRWFIDPNQQPLNSSNAQISFITNDNRLYIVRARYDPQTNQIFSPVEVPRPGEWAEPPLIRWEDTQTVFSDNPNFTPPIPNHYVDTETRRNVPQNYFDQIFRSIDTFQSERYKYYFRTAETITNGDQCALVKEWKGRNAQIQFWLTTSEPETIGNDTYVSDHGWAIIYGTPTSFLVTGNYGQHPFVLTPTFSFANSDGSTGDNDITFDLPSINLDQVKQMLKTKTAEYIFNQRH